jgi:hypothetical protein
MASVSSARVKTQVGLVPSAHSTRYHRTANKTGTEASKDSGREVTSPDQFLAILDCQRNSATRCPSSPRYQNETLVHNPPDGAYVLYEKAGNHRYVKMGGKRDA